MGATALANRYMYDHGRELVVFGVRFAHRLQEKAPREADFKDQGNGDIRLSVQTEEDKDIIFQ